MSAQIISINTAISAPGVVLFRTDGITAFPISMSPSQAFPLQSLQVSVASGTVATLGVQIEVSLNGTDWAVLGTPITNVAGGILTAAIQFPFPNVRVNVTALTGTAPVIKVMLGVGRFFQG